MKYHIEHHDLNGSGPRRVRVYEMHSVSNRDYWLSVTDVHCPRDGCDGGCDGTILWHEAGHVPGYRRCNTCHRHFLA